MKSTGIIRKIDDLGRIVIPKELRKKLFINNNDELEIYVDENNIVLKKYERLLNIKDVSEEIIKVFKKYIDFNLIIVDLNKVVFSTIKDYKESMLSKNLKDILNERKMYEGSTKEQLKISEEITLECPYNIYPIIKEASLLGGIITFTYESDLDIRKFSKIILDLIKERL